MGGRHRRDTIQYLSDNCLNVDWRGERHDYDLVVTCSDLIIQNNIRGKRLVLVQEGITEPEGFMYWLVKWLKLPRYLANTAATGLSKAYDIFCVASHGYHDLFVRKGVKSAKIAVTGIPNFDHFKELISGESSHHHSVLVATSALRECFIPDNRETFIKKCVQIANGRPLTFKLHPLENARRAQREIQKYAPGSLVVTEGKVEPMIANCQVLITQRSTCTFVGVALGKEVHTDLNINHLRHLMPIQNNGTSSILIGNICRRILNTPISELIPVRTGFRSRPHWEQADGY